MKLKRIGAALLAGAMLFSLAACGQNSSSSAQSDTASAPAADTPGESQSDTAASGGKVLVAYFSGTGNTERVAEAIADTTGGDLFEITPAEPYTSDDLNYADSESRVSREHDDESLRDVPLTTTEVENWDEYDTVFLGYPIWWGIAAWPVNNFVKDNDFTGKTVIPFATSASSGIGQSGELLEELTGTGDWQVGERFSSGADANDVAAWVDSLGLNG